jgi:hypothetical protein
MNNTPTPRTDNAARAYQTAGMPAAYTVILSHARQLERELSEVKLWIEKSNTVQYVMQVEAERDQLKDNLAMAEVRHAAAMMHTQSIVDENTQLRNVADELALAIHTGNEHGYGLRIGDRAITLYNLYLLSAGHKKVKEGTK